MHGMTGPVSNHIAQDLPSNQRQITDEVKNLVTDKLIVKTERRIHQASLGEDKGVFIRRTPNQTLLPHRFGFMQKTKCARGSNIRDVLLIRKIEAKGLVADQRMGEVDGVRDGIRFGRVYTNEFVGLAQLKGTGNPNVSPRTALLANAHLAD